MKVNISFSLHGWFGNTLLHNPPNFLLHRLQPQSFSYDYYLYFRILKIELTKGFVVKENWKKYESRKGFVNRLSLFVKPTSSL